MTTATKIWASIFGVWSLWLLFLSGFISSPGVLQLVRLQDLLASKNQQSEILREAIRKLEVDSTLLEKSKIVQQREIRRVLGYAAPDELIFDFSTPEHR